MFGDSSTGQDLENKNLFKNQEWTSTANCGLYQLKTINWFSVAVEILVALYNTDRPKAVTTPP